MNFKLLTEQHLEFLSLTECCKGLSESTHVKIPHCWKSHVAAQMCFESYTGKLKPFKYENVYSAKCEQPVSEIPKLFPYSTQLNLNAVETQTLRINMFLALKFIYFEFVLLINVNLPTNVRALIMARIDIIPS